ncbi:MAG: AIPR family protein, partial [Nitrospira sp.]|nr:AIPR family protein [Nitrospira sp.]
MDTTLEVRLPVTDYRAHKIPGHSYNGESSRIGSAYVCVSEIPDGLRDWMDVNPRKPDTKASSAKEQAKLTGRVARRIINTLETDPSQMAVKNQGIYLLVDSAESHKASGGQEFLTLKFSDSSRHGIVNGGHTFFAIRQVADSNGTDLSDAYVRLHIMQNIDPDEILELADGLNRAMQVKDKSLDELQGLFQPIKDALKGCRGEDEVVYAEGDNGVIDVEEMIIRVSML